VSRRAAGDTAARAVDRLDGESDDKGLARNDRNGREPGARAETSFRRSGAVMGIYDREYYRGESAGSGWFWNVAPVCKWIILINAAVFLLQNIFHLDDRFFEFAASPAYTLRQFHVWQLLTATFLHAHLLHLVGNMWFLWIVGREMEALYGSRDFLAFYLSAAVISTLGWVLFDAATARDEFHQMIGASGAVMAVVMLFTLYYPKREILFIFIPMPMWVLLAIYLFFPMLPHVTGLTSDIAVESHLTGAAFAFLYKQLDLRWSRLTSGRAFRPRLRIFSPVTSDQGRPRSPNPARTSISVESSGKPASVSVLPEEQLDARLDEVLAKIAREGRAGLTEDDHRVLQEASRRARMRRSDRL
jgi:membrane associated rhomboid family serine protease